MIKVTLLKTDINNAKENYKTNFDVLFEDEDLRIGTTQSDILRLYDKNSHVVKYVFNSDCWYMAQYVEEK